MATEAPTTTTQPAGTGLAITSMVTGISSLVFTFVPFVNFGLSVVAVIFGILALKKRVGKGMAIAGVVTGGVGLLSTVVQGIFWLIVIAAAAAQS